MRQTFDNKVPRFEQLLRAAGRKKVGRKHNHTLGPGKAAAKYARSNAFARQRMTAKFAKFGAAVRAYWRGERDEFPPKP